MKKEPGELDWFLRRSRKDEIEEMLPGLRSLSKSEPRSLTSSPLNVERVGESVVRGKGACWSSFELKKGRDSSKESDLGRGIEPLTAVASKPCTTRRETRKSIASFKPPALLRVYARVRRAIIVASGSFGA